MKIFDYKFIIILSLSLVVYFLYREIEQLSKRMNAFENKKQLNIDSVLELPLPPRSEFFKQNIPGLLEVSIGHALISEAIYLGLDNVVNMYLQKLK